MTLIQAPPPGARSTPGGGATRGGSAPDGVPSRRAEAGRAVARLVTSSAILTLGGSLLGFAMWIGAGSGLHYDRVQHDTYASFRAELAQAIAPTGPTDPLHPKQVLPLGSPVALLTIPEIGLKTVVLEGTTGQTMEGGPGHLRDTQLPGQAGISVIMGRRAAYGGPFARLASLSPGQLFSVTTGQGVSRYRVLDRREASDPVPPYYPGQGRLILVTADGPAFAPSGVLRIDANLISKPQASPAMVISAADIGSNEAAMGTDSVAWVPLVLWGQGLLLTAIALGWADAVWGRWQTWVVAVPVLGFFGLAVADQVARLLPNLM